MQARPIESTQALAAVVTRALGGRRGSRIHPATRTFQALRIAVNDELRHLERTLPQCLEVLRPGGRLAIVSFHSLEDRIVKRWMQQEASTYVHDAGSVYGGYPKQPSLRLLNRKPIVAGADELSQNPRARSAKLRGAERL